jgi:K+-transporting ATPase ATPase C chain
MKKELIIALKMLATMSLLTGIIYPFLITGIAQVMAPHQANGSLLTHEQKVIGSSLIAQKFTSDRYFWPRPSAVDYNPLPSGGSNWGPTSTSLKKAVAERKAALMKDNQVNSGQKVPSDLLFSSGSGLDPHISQKAALFQIERVIKARNMDRATLERMINKMTVGRKLGFLGVPYINVLELNRALDEEGRQ